jgi:hypothetical protein
MAKTKHIVPTDKERIILNTEPSRFGTWDGISNGEALCGVGLKYSGSNIARNREEATCPKCKKLAALLHQ